MTGMLNFNLRLCLLCIATYAGAAEISFSGKNKISGELIAMDIDGTVTLNAPHSNEPIKINPDGIQKIDFGKSDINYELLEQNITLINGDSLPVEIRSLDDKVLKVHSPSMGEMNISRELINSLEVGIFSKKTIYKGPNEIREWSSPKDQATEWAVENNMLFCDGSGTIYRDMKLLDNYSIRFKLKWANFPNFKFTFGDPMDFKGTSVNRYYFQFNRAGMQIRRESTGNQRYFPIAQIARMPQEFAAKELLMEVRVNRKNGSIELYLDDRLQDKYTDSYPNKPSGTGISFHAEAADDNQISITNIEISQWDDRADRHRAEERGDLKEDAVIGNNGERFGGRILSITNANDRRIYRFKSNFQAEAMDLTDSEVSTIYFAATAPDKKLEEFKGLNLFFRGGGSCQVSKCSFNGDKVNISHPLLGEIQLNRSVVSHLERNASAKPNPLKVDNLQKSIR
jgi:hypothetical protein